MQNRSNQDVFVVMNMFAKTENTAKSTKNSRKTDKTRRKPVEIRCFPLTNASESRKVNGGRVSGTRINPVDPRIALMA